MAGTVYVARKQRGHKHPTRPGCITIDVTTASRKKLGNDVFARDVSPLFLGPVTDPSDGMQACRFENLWQYNKVYPQLGHLDSHGQLTEKWQAWRAAGFQLTRNGKGIRTPPQVQALKRRCQQWAPAFAQWRGQALGYIDSRKQVYVPVYYDLIKDSAVVHHLQALVAEGQDIIILDYDGPRLPDSLEVSVDSLRQYLNDPAAPFGHGYVVAAAAAQLPPTLWL